MYEKVILPTDGSEFALKGVKEGLDLASSMDIPVTAIYVIEFGDIKLSNDISSHFEEAAAKALDQIEEEADKKGVELDKKISKGAPFKKITDIADDKDIIFIASHGHSGFRELFMGSTTERVLKRAKCTVAVVKGQE